MEFRQFRTAFSVGILPRLNAGNIENVESGQVENQAQLPWRVTTRPQIDVFHFPKLIADVGGFVTHSAQSVKLRLGMMLE